MLLSVSNLSKSFDGQTIINEASFHVEEHEKAAIVGINGAGKTTLLKMIVGLLPPDQGMVTVSKDCTIGYLSQRSQLDETSTIYEEVKKVKQYMIDLEEELRKLEDRMNTDDHALLSETMHLYEKKTHEFEINGGYYYKSEINGVLKGLGFDESEYNNAIKNLSGGQKTRVSLACLLLESPDLIILDEPTNHLDISSINWLENYLLNYKGAVLIVSHDRYFLDKIVSKVIAIDNGNVRSYQGNYSDFSYKSAQIRKAQISAYIKQQAEIAHQQQVIDKLKSFNREKSIKRAESREKALEKIDILDKPIDTRDDMSLKLTPRIMSGNDVLSIRDLSKSFDELLLFNDTNIEIKRGEHVAIIGDNGTGKTTLLKIINNLYQADKGEIVLGSKVEIGYYDQEHHVLHEEKTLFDEISDDYPHLSNTEIRNTLAAFLFTGDDVFKKISTLSGGERGRVSLAKLMLSNANFLILDEPTNHLDITSKEILEQALNQYEGTVLYVSHDRYFVNQTAHRILCLHQKKFYSFLGNYDYYLEKKDTILPIMPIEKSQKILQNASSSTISGNNLSANSANTANAVSAAKTDTKLDWEMQKQAQALARKKENAIKKCEDRIATLESSIETLTNQMNDPQISSNSYKLQEIAKELEKLNNELEQKYEEWEQLSE